MTNREALNINVNGRSINRSELSKAVTQLRKTAKAREKTIGRSGYYSHALTQLKESGALQSKNRNLSDPALLRNYRALQRFMEAQGSTIAGLRRIDKEISERPGMSNYSKWSKEDKRSYWEAYDHANEALQNAKSVLGSSEVQRLVMVSMNNGYNEQQMLDLIQNAVNTKNAELTRQFEALLEEEFWNG